MNDYQTHLNRFYDLLAQLETRSGGKCRLAECDGRMGWPDRGVYFFFEDGELRPNGTPRVARVGTHGLMARSSTTLWLRLAQHRGTVGGSRPGGGNHRGSIFRLHVGTALLASGRWSESIRRSWSVGMTASSDVRLNEYPLEQAVSEHIGAMPFLWLGVDDPPGPTSDRGVIEAGAIALLSNFARRVEDSSTGWLGRKADRETIRASGLWNVNHVQDEPEAGFLDTLESHVLRATG